MNWNTILKNACDFHMMKATDKLTYNFYFKMKENLKGGN